jgi:two-component system, NarL family, response regulator NreC
MTIRVLIADDHAVVAEGLRYLIEAQEDMQVIACVHEGREAVRSTVEMEPDIVLMDIAMPELNGTEATHIICERLAETRVIMLSMFSDPIHVCRALQAGATGYVVKKAAAKEVVDAIRAVHDGRRYLSKPLTDGVIDQFISGTGTGDPLQRLSSRERQVLQMLVEGSSVVDIAATLSLSPKTVETYRARMMNKLGIREVPSLVKFAIQHGIASLE